jgi:membrane associated rhomboid family serine protease
MSRRLQAICAFFCFIYWQALLPVLYIPFAIRQSMTPLVGASGAIAGVVGAYVLLLPRAKIVVLLLGIVPIRLRAIWVVSIWLALQVLGILVPQMHGGISYWGHVAGFVAGCLVLLVLRRADVPLLGRWHGNT